LTTLKNLYKDVDIICTAQADWMLRMNDLQMHNGTSAGLTLLEPENDFHSPELDVLREALKRAAEARIAAETALMQAHETEAKLIAEEQRARSAASAARHAHLIEAARTAVEREREAVERVSKIDAQLLESQRMRGEIQAESNRIAQSLDEARRALENLVAAAAEHELRSENAAATERQLETERTAAFECAEGAARIREAAEAALQAPVAQQTATPAPFAPLAPPQPDPVVHAQDSGMYQPAGAAGAFDVAAARAQRAAERRAADAARAVNA
jgi:chromosome segregation ATPase